MKPHVLVTGGFGYVGSVLTPTLLASGYRVRVLDLCLYGERGWDNLRQTPQYRANPERFSFVRGDIRDASCVEEAVVGIDAIIHLAAISNDPTGNLDEQLTRQVNFDAVGMLLSLARTAGVRRFINASSSSVFGVRAEEDVNESLEPAPVTCYSKYKALSEWLVRCAASPELVAVNVRPATICGVSPRLRLDLTVNKLTADCVLKGVITVHGGSQRRPNVAITDVVRLYELLLTTPAAAINGKTFNFGFENLSVRAIAELVATTLRRFRPRIEVTDSADARDYHISSDRLRRELSFAPVSGIAREVEGLAAALERGDFGDGTAREFYNLECMRLERDGRCYAFFAR